MKLRVALIAVLLLLPAVAGGCSRDEGSEPVPSAAETKPAAETPAEDDKFIDAFAEVVPTSPNEKAVAAKSATYYDAWVAYKHNISPDAKLPTLDELGGNTPKFIGYKVDAYSGKDPNGDSGHFTLVVSGDQMNIPTEIGWKAPIDLADQSTLDFFSTRTPLDSWDADPSHVPVSAGEKAAVKKVQDFVDTLPKNLLFTRDRVRLSGYTLFWGDSPAAEKFVIMSVQPGENKHYAATNYTLQ